MMNIGVLGAGTWGMALARVLCLNGHRVTVRPSRPETAARLDASRVHPNLPGMVIPQEITFTSDMAQACTGKDVVLFAVPSPYVRATARSAAPYLTDGQVLVDVAKGIEADTLLTMSGIIEQEIDNPAIKLVALSGPTHAEEVSRDLPTTIVSASHDMEAAKLVQELFRGSCMRVYTNDDVLGVELCGALKNIMSLASGISAGLGFGDNIKAAIITRGLVEMTALGMAMGCKPTTFGGLAGVGDLIVTATSQHSRNNRCGMYIGQGMPVSQAVEKVGMVVEGLNALPAAMKLKDRYGIEMPIVETMHAVVNQGLSPKDAVQRLMARDSKPEFTFLYNMPSPEQYNPR